MTSGKDRQDRGYRPNRAVRPIAAAVALGIAALPLLALLTPISVRRIAPERMAAFDVQLTPPPPAATEAAPPRPQTIRRASIVAPPPLVAISQASPPMVEVAPAQAERTPEPAPREPIPIPVPIAASPAPISRNLVATVLSAVPPSYPTASRRKREQGTVVLAVLVGADGRVRSVSVSRTSGSPRLDDAALGAVRKWRWSPTLVEGVAVEVRGLVEIPFVLRER